MSPYDFENMSGIARDRREAFLAEAHTDRELRLMRTEQAQAEQAQAEPTAATEHGVLAWLRQHIHIGRGHGHGGGHLPQHG